MGWEGAMREGHERDLREHLWEAFVAGWQAALAVRISDPRVLAVIESSFDGWLAEAADEVEVLGLPFRRRPDLPLGVPQPVLSTGSRRADRSA